MEQIRILCYGDSNTWGYISGSDHQRYGNNERWTKILASLLGQKFEIIEEGLNSRTLISNDLRPGKEGKNGYEYLIPCLDTHDPIDLVILMEDNYLRKIVKIYKGGADILDEFVNKVESKDTIFLTRDDFKRFNNLYKNMQNKNNYRKKAIIDAYAELLSYEYFQSVVLEDCGSISMDELFDDLNESYNYKEYKDEIKTKSIKILKDKYKVS